MVLNKYAVFAYLSGGVEVYDRLLLTDVADEQGAIHAKALDICTTTGTAELNIHTRYVYEVPDGQNDQ